MSQHTPEPWVLDESYKDSPQIRKSTPDKWGTYHAIVDGGIGGEAVFDNHPDAARIVACVNACAGMEDPAKEIEELKEKARRRKHDRE